jgi:hypothetical protein
MIGICLLSNPCVQRTLHSTVAWQHCSWPADSSAVLWHGLADDAICC